MIISLADLEREFGRIAMRVSDLSPLTRVGGIMGVGDWKKRLSTGTDLLGRPFAPLKYPRPQGGTVPLRNTGLLLNSVTSLSTPVLFRVGTVAKQAALMNFGGTVRPVKAKYLSLPATKEAVYAGSPRNMPSLHPVINRQRTGGVLLDSRGVVQYYLTKSVTVPPREFAGFSEEMLGRYRLAAVNYLRTGIL